MMGKQQTIPAQWVIVPLCEVAEINPRLDKSAFAEDAEVSFVPMPAVEAETGKIDVSQIKRFGEVKKGYTSFKKRDVLFAKITPCMENGKVAVVPDLQNNIGFGSTEFHVLRHNHGIEPSFLYYFVSSKGFRFDAKHNMTGAVGQKRVPTIYLENCNIPLPPSIEQQRIVSKLEELLSELDKGIDSFKTAREQLTVYRQAVLKHAFEGKLTEEWRKKHADELEPAETLLEKIKAEREQRYRQQLEDWKQAVKAWGASGKEGKKPTKPGKPKELPPLTEAELSELSELPGMWAWIRFHNIVLESCLGKMLDKSKNVGTSIPYLRNINVRWGSFDLSDLLNMKFEEGEKERYGLQSGDLIICEGGEPGRCAIWKQSNSDMRIQKALHRVRFPTKSIANKFAYYFMLFSSSNGHLSKSFTGTTIKHLTGKGLANLEFPVCSIAEQNQIVQQIESRLSVAEKLEQDIEDGLKQAEALRQSLLKKAFEGKLVPQDPNDEPISVLLERVRAEREAKAQAAKKTKKKSGKKTSRKKPKDQQGILSL